MWLFFVAIGHAPQFVRGTDAILKHHNDISQAVYFKGPGKLRVDNPKAGKLVQASFSRADPVGDLFVGCGSFSMKVNMSSTVDGTIEPFTQTRYFTLYDSAFPECVSSFTLRGTFDEPWAVVVGKKEQFSAWELLAFPVYSAKLHGSWWNEHYAYHWWFYVAAIMGVVVRNPRVFVAFLFFASAADRLTHAWTPVVFVDIIPGLFVLFPKNWATRWGWRLFSAIAIIALLAFGWSLPINWLVAFVLILTLFCSTLGHPLVCLFFLGSGYVIAPIVFILVRAFTRDARRLVEATDNWKKYSSLLLKQRTVCKNGESLLKSHGYQLRFNTIKPLDDTEWLVIVDPQSNDLMRTAWRLVCERGKLSPDGLEKERDIILLRAPSYIETRCPHTYADADTNSSEPCYIVFPKGSTLSTQTMIHECVHIYQKRTGVTEKSYLNRRTIDQYLAMKPDVLETLRFNPDANPIKYVSGSTDMMITEPEKTAGLERMAYDWTASIAPGAQSSFNVEIKY